jgi:hypothetical protein
MSIVSKRAEVMARAPVVFAGVLKKALRLNFLQVSYPRGGGVLSRHFDVLAKPPGVLGVYGVVTVDGHAVRRSTHSAES